MLRVLDLFSGIGGFSLGLERAGMKTVAFCEIESFPRKVLAKHWPEVPIYDDVRTLTAERLAADGVAVDVICGGFPCQDISLAGNGAGLAGERSGLWSEYSRLIGELRPSFVIVENVAALLGRGLGTVLGDLAEIGYDAEWHCIPASFVGAPHRRDRIWIMAYPSRERCREAWRFRSDQSEERASGGGEETGAVSDTNRPERWSKREACDGLAQRTDCLCQRQEGPGRFSASGEALDVTNSAGLEILFNRKAGEFETAFGTHGWSFEPDVGRVAYGVPARVDRLKGLGNAVVPQIPEIIGHAIMTAHQEFA